jgi:hypothetical protein
LSGLTAHRTGAELRAWLAAAEVEEKYQDPDEYVA